MTRELRGHGRGTVSIWVMGLGLLACGTVGSRPPPSTLDAAGDGGGGVGEGPALSDGGSSTDGGARLAWMITSANASDLLALDPWIAAHFFGGPQALIVGPVPSGWSSQQARTYTSYAQLAADLDAGRVDTAIRWVAYDIEHWAGTPANEQADPVEFIKLFGDLAHAHGLKVLAQPARDLTLVAGSPCQATAGTSEDQAIIDCQLASSAASLDVFQMQGQVEELDAGAYGGFIAQVSAGAKSANPRCGVFDQLSTRYSIDVPTLVAAFSAASPHVTGMYLALPQPTSPTQPSRAAQLEAAIELLRQLEALGE